MKLYENFDDLCPKKCTPVSIPSIKSYEDWPICEYLDFDEFDCAFEIAKTQFRNASYMDKCLNSCTTFQYIGKGTDINVYVMIFHEIFSTMTLKNYFKFGSFSLATNNSYFFKI